jgi:ribonuclease T1
MTRWFKNTWVSVRSLLSAGLLGVAVIAAPGIQAKGPVPAVAQTSPSIALADLPKQGRETYALILAGGPFPYEKDGTVFGNRERILPAQKRGFYREYTVKTPYARTRGANLRCVTTPKTITPASSESRLSAMLDQQVPAESFVLFF